MSLSCLCLRSAPRACKNLLATTPEYVSPEDQRLLIGRAKIKAYRFPKGTSGNPDGLSKFYFEARQLVKQASPDMMQVLINIAKDAYHPSI